MAFEDATIYTAMSRFLFEAPMRQPVTWKDGYPMKGESSAYEHMGDSRYTLYTEKCNERASDKKKGPRNVNLDLRLLAALSFGSVVQAVTLWS